MAFESTRFIPVTVPDLTPVAQDVMLHFQKQGFEVSSERTAAAKWRVSLRKGDVFKAVVGMKTALNIDIETTDAGTVVKAGVGIFGLQAIPTAVAVLVFWPVVLAQIWGVVQQSKLDGEAVTCIEASLAAHNPKSPGPASPRSAAPRSSASGEPSAGFCSNCGAKLQPPGKFCSGCGNKVA